LAQVTFPNRSSNAAGAWITQVGLKGMRAGAWGPSRRNLESWNRNTENELL